MSCPLAAHSRRAGYRLRQRPDVRATSEYLSGQHAADSCHGCDPM